MSNDDPIEQGEFLLSERKIHRQLQPILAPEQNTILPPEVAALTRQIGATLKQARTLVEIAEKEANTIRKEARREGLEQGLVEAAGALSLARREYRLLQDRAEEDLVKLALSLARKIVGHHFEVEPEALAGMIANTLTLAHGRRQITLRVNPQDHTSLQDHHHHFTTAVGEATLCLIADEEVPQGGCRIETEAGFINADLDVQISALAKALGVKPWQKQETRDHE